MDRPETGLGSRLVGRRRAPWGRFGLAWALVGLMIACAQPAPTPREPTRVADSARGSNGSARGEAARERYRSFLRYYAPLILKQADEAPGLAGRDWITNFFFDDERLSNNRVQWVDGLPGFVEGDAHRDWQIRPTLYAHAIEYAEPSERSLVLVYHIYHAMQAWAIHDWERVEIRLDGVTEQPGRGERVRFVVTTRHSAHLARGPEQLQWLENKAGKHVLIWQAPWSSPWNGALAAALPWTGFERSPRKAELRFVEERWPAVAAGLRSKEPARVAVSGTLQPYPVHYVFVPGFNRRAATRLGAGQISVRHPGRLAARKRSFETSAGLAVPRICYELQDTADIFVTHWTRRAGEGGRVDWEPPTVPVWIEDPVRDESGAIVIPAGLHEFLTISADDSALPKRRRATPPSTGSGARITSARPGTFAPPRSPRARPGGAARSPTDATIAWEPIGTSTTTSPTAGSIATPRARTSAGAGSRAAGTSRVRGGLTDAGCSSSTTRRRVSVAATRPRRCRPPPAI